MLVSMTPNDEVKTIHASLNDGKLRKWEFEPYTENGKIELTDQDYATIQSIKGNTIKFNQLVNINISSPYISLVNGIINLTGTPSGTIGVSTVTIKHDTNHKYFLFAKTLANPNNVSFTLGVGQGQPWVADAGVVGDHSKIYQSSYQTQLNLYDVANKDLTGIKFICMTFDLTAMEIDNLTTVEQVETWLSTHIGDLPYYDYTQGSLISFNATGLKTENASQTESNTLSLPISTYFPTGMKSAGNVYDELTDSKAKTRLGQVVLDGTQTVSASNFDSDTCRMFISIPDIQGKTYPQDEVDTDVISSYLLPISNDLSNYGTAGIHRRVNGLQQLCVSLGISAYASGITTEALFNQYLSEHPLTVYYPLATPIEQDISLDLTYPIWNNGTEQILPVNGSAPTTSSMKATIEYPDRTEEVNFLYKQTTFGSAIPQFSLVCKNQELPMALENDKLICECDSSITNESGFFDCKVKMQDLNSVAYSQKIQLHVERGIND